MSIEDISSMQAAWVDESPTCLSFKIKPGSKICVDCQETITTNLTSVTASRCCLSGNRRYFGN